MPEIQSPTVLALWTNDRQATDQWYLSFLAWGEGSSTLINWLFFKFRIEQLQLYVGRLQAPQQFYSLSSSLDRGQASKDILSRNISTCTSAGGRGDSLQRNDGRLY